MDQALVMDFRKKDMINNINIIMIILMLELLEWKPIIPEFRFQAVCGKSFAEKVIWKEFTERVKLAAD